MNGAILVLYYGLITDVSRHCSKVHENPIC